MPLTTSTMEDLLVKSKVAITKSMSDQEIKNQVPVLLFDWKRL